jgi:hypothetical protein
LSSLLIFFFFIQACNTDPEDPIAPNQDDQNDLEQPKLDPIHQYFVDIAFGNEFSGGYTSVRKWSSNMKIYVPEIQYDYLNDELDRIIGELNSLLTEMQIERVLDQIDANYIIYFGGKDTYVNIYEPNAVNLVEDNWGLFYIYWNSNWSINSGSMYVDVIRTLDLGCQKHLLREELTQSLGLMNDTMDYPASIFYQQWTCGTVYANIDTELIKLLYDPNITPGMSKQVVINYLFSLQAS